jgi:hypothetical protein
MDTDKHGLEMKAHEILLLAVNQSSAPKAQNMIAQGNALGLGSQIINKP